jgi:hypothetical protein
MSRRLWVTAVIIIIALAAVLVLSFIALNNRIPTLLVAVLVVLALAAGAFQYLVVSPAMLEAAKNSARPYCDAGEIIDPGLKKKLCDRLAAARDDPEAARLNAKLKELQQKK